MTTITLVMMIIIVIVVIFMLMLATLNKKEHCDNHDQRWRRPVHGDGHYAYDTLM